MANDKDLELERLQRELLAGLPEEDDLLADMPMELLDTVPINWEEFMDQPAETEHEMEFVPENIPEIIPEPPVEEKEDMPKKTISRKNAKKREDRYLVILMAIASFLCLGIIGLLIYWLEVFLK